MEYRTEMSTIVPEYQKKTIRNVQYSMEISNIKSKCRLSHQNIEYRNEMSKIESKYRNIEPTYRMLKHEKNGIKIVNTE